jgi:hypothetical protein
VKLPDEAQRLDQDIRLADRFFMHGLVPRSLIHGHRARE